MRVSSRRSSFVLEKRLAAGIAQALALSFVVGPLAAQDTGQNGRTLGGSIEEIIITDRSLETSLPLELSRYGADLEMVTAEQVRNHGFVDVGQALEMLVPGVHLTTNSGAFSYVNLAMQGSRGSDVLWTVDGVRINNRLYNTTSPADTLPSSMIERTEVLKGGWGMMYGTQAIAGVVNVVTRSFSDTPDGAISVGTGSDGLRRVNGYGRGALGDHKFVVWASRDESDGYELYSDYQPSATHRKRAYDVESFGAKYGYDFTPNLRLTLMGIHTEAALDDLSVSRLSVNDRNEEIFSARLDYTPSDATQFFLKSYYHDWDTDYYSPPEEGDYWGYEDFGFSAGTLLKPSEYYELHLGYDFQTYEGQDDVLLIAPEREDVHAVYAQVRTSDALWEKGRLSAGARYNETEGVSSTVWSASGIYEINDYLYVQSVVGTSFMLPSAANLYRIHCPSGEGCTHGNPNLEPEESVSLNVSVGGRLDVAERPLSWQLTMWKRKVDNLITTQAIPEELLDQFPPGFTRSYFNLPTEAKVDGAEILLRGPITQALSFNVSYTYSRERAVNSDFQIPDRPRRQYKGSLAYAHPTLPFGFNLAFKYVGEKNRDVPGFGYQTYGDNYIVDAGAHVFVDGRDGHHRLTLRLENALDETSATSVSSAIREGTSDRFLYQRLAPPRTVSLNYNYTF